MRTHFWSRKTADKHTIGLVPRDSRTWHCTGVRRSKTKAKGAAMTKAAMEKSIKSAAENADAAMRKIKSLNATVATLEKRVNAACDSLVKLDARARTREEIDFACFRIYQIARETRHEMDSQGMTNRIAEAVEAAIGPVAVREESLAIRCEQLERMVADLEKRLQGK